MATFKVIFGPGYEIRLQADQYRLEQAGMVAFVTFYLESFWGRERVASYDVGRVASVERVFDEK